MKKILTIVAMALVLCLAISALADIDPNEYKAEYVGKVSTNDPVTGLRILSVDEIMNLDNWKIVKKNPVPSSSDLNDSSKVLQEKLSTTLRNLLVSSAKAEDEIKVVEVKILGEFVHGMPNVVNVVGDNGKSYEFTVMVKGNEHDQKGFERAILADGQCHTRRLCSVCGHEYAWSARPDHDPDGIVTYVEDGKDVAFCTVCNHVVTGTNSHEHKPLKVWDEPTCLNGAKARYYLICAVEGCEEYLVPFSGLNYRVSEEPIWVDATMAEFLDDPQNADWKDAATTDPKALYDDPNFGYYDAEGHWWGEWVVARPADCRNAELLARSCYFCDSVITTEGEPAKGVRYAQTTIPCNFDKDIELKCIYCNGVYAGHSATIAAGSDWATITALGLKDPDDNDAITIEHSFNFNVNPVTVSATCTKGGSKTWTCRYSTNHVDDGKGTFTMYTAELGHQWGDWTCFAEPQWNARGIWVRTCTRVVDGVLCGVTERYVGYYNPALQETCEHPEEAIEILDEEEATCTEDGYVEWVCTNCGYSDVEIIEAKGHDFDKPVTIKAPTCEEDGIAVGKCKVCGFYGESVVKATGHNLVYHAKVEATCKDEGTAEYYECSNCHKLFADKEEKVELKSPVTIAKTTDHKWDDGKVTKEATTEAKGEKTYTCTVCGETKVEEIDKELPTAKYTLSGVAYDGMAVSGKVAHVDGTKELDKVYVRVTFFYTDGTYAAMVVPVEDGEFYAGATTACQHIAAQVVDNVKQVAPPKTDAIYGNANAKMENK